MNNSGKKAVAKTARTDHMAREIEQLKKKLAQAQAIIDLQKKVSELLGTHILSHDSSEVN
jgi:transposase